MSRGKLVFLLVSVAAIVTLAIVLPLNLIDSKPPQYSDQVKNAVLEKATAELEANGFFTDSKIAEFSLGEYITLAFHEEEIPEAVEIVRSVINEMAPGLPLEILEHVHYTTIFPTAELNGTQWELISINDSEILEGSHISLYFRNESVWGFSGCNIYGGSYSAEAPNILTIPVLEMTVIGCSESIIEQERAYANSLQNAAFYRIIGKHLEIENAANQKMLVFERKPEFPMNPADLVGTSWQLISINSDQVVEGLSITLTFDSDSEASGRAGCFDYVLHYEANGDDIRWGMSTKRNGELPQELEFQALRYTDSIMWGANYRLTAEQLEIFTAKGDILVFKSR